MCCIHMLRGYTEYEETIFRKRATIQPFKCPLQFQKAYDAFNKACIEREYSYQGFQAIIKPVRNFLIFIDNSNIELSEKITAPLISKFLSVYISCKPRYIATIISGLKNYLNFQYKKECGKD